MTHTNQENAAHVRIAHASGLISYCASNEPRISISGLFYHIEPLHHPPLLLAAAASPRRRARRHRSRHAPRPAWPSSRRAYLIAWPAKRPGVSVPALHRLVSGETTPETVKGKPTVLVPMVEAALVKVLPRLVDCYVLLTTSLLAAVADILAAKMGVREVVFVFSAVVHGLLPAPQGGLVAQGLQDQPRPPCQLQPPGRGAVDGGRRARLSCFTSPRSSGTWATRPLDTELFNGMVSALPRYSWLPNFLQAVSTCILCVYLVALCR